MNQRVGQYFATVFHGETVRAFVPPPLPPVPPTWVEFFLTGVRDTARQAVTTAQEIHTLFEQDVKRVQALGRAASSAGRVYRHAQQNPVISIVKAARESGLTFPTVSDAVEQLERIGILKEITGRQRGRLYVYWAYLSILSQGTEPLPL